MMTNNFLFLMMFLFITIMIVIASSGSDATTTFTPTIRMSGDNFYLQLYSDGRIAARNDKDTNSVDYGFFCDDGMSFETSSKLGIFLNVAGDRCSWESSYSSGKFAVSDVVCEWSDSNFDQCTKNTNPTCTLDEVVKLKECWYQSQGLSSGPHWSMRISDDGSNRLEVRPLNQLNWGTVAFSQQTTYTTATHLCRLFGFSAGTSRISATKLRRTAYSPGIVYMNNLSCSSTATSIFDCYMTKFSDVPFNQGDSDVALTCGFMTAAEASSSIFGNNNNNNNNDDESDSTSNLQYIVPGVWVGIILIWLLIRGSRKNDDEDEANNNNNIAGVVVTTNGNNEENLQHGTQMSPMNSSMFVTTGNVVGSPTFGNVNNNNNNESWAEKQRREEDEARGRMMMMMGGTTNNMPPPFGYQPLAAGPPPLLPAPASSPSFGTGDDTAPPPSSYNFGVFGGFGGAYPPPPPPLPGDSLSSSPGLQQQQFSQQPPYNPMYYHGAANPSFPPPPVSH